MSSFAKPAWSNAATSATSDRHQSAAVASLTHPSGEDSLGPESSPEQARGLLQRWVTARAAESDGTLTMLQSQSKAYHTCHPYSRCTGRTDRD